MTALGVDEATPGPGAALAAEPATLAVAVLAANRATDAEEDSGDEEGGDGAPGEAVSVSAEAGVLVVGAEDVASENGPCTMNMLVTIGMNDYVADTHVIRAAASVWKKSAIMALKPEM